MSGSYQIVSPEPAAPKKRIDMLCTKEQPTLMLLSKFDEQSDVTVYRQSSHGFSIVAVLALRIVVLEDSSVRPTLEYW
jgi:hypothetical protein